jgi:hypothetical protein
MTELETDVNARKFRTVNGVGRGSGSYQDLTWAYVVGWVTAAPSAEELPILKLSV